MDGPRNIILNKISQRKTNTNDIPYRWSLKYDTNEFVYETDSQTQTTDLWLLMEAVFGYHIWSF